MHTELNNFLKPTFIDFTNKKLSKAPDEGRSIKQLYLKNMQFFEYDTRDIKRNERRRKRFVRNAGCHVSGRDLRKQGSGAPILKVGILGADCRTMASHLSLTNHCIATHSMTINKAY